VEITVRNIPGGLGKKRENWVKHLHLIISIKRKQFGFEGNSDGEHSPAGDRSLGCCF